MPLPWVKLVICGEYGAGKSALLCQFIHEDWNENWPPGCEEYRRHVPTRTRDQTTGQPVTVECMIVGTEGVERFIDARRSFYHEAKGAALVYDVTNAESLHQLEKWYRQLLGCSAQLSDGTLVRPALVLVGAKMDLCASENDMAVSREEAEAFARDHGGMPFILTSAKTGAGVRDVFVALADQVVTRPELMEGYLRATVSITPTKRSFCNAF